MPEINAARKLILGIRPKVHEGVKWNSVSFRTADYFATINTRSRDSLQLILHRGAKVKDNASAMKIPDPRGLIRWLATDRCLLSLGAGLEFKSNVPAFRRIIRAWIKQL